MYVANCSLKYNPDYFTVVNKVLTEATQPIDVYTPTYSTGVTAKFDEAVYAEEIGKETTTFTATVVDTTTTWSDGTSTVTMADVGITDIVGAVDGSTIKITYSEGTEPRTELVGDPFIAHHCGGLLLDDGVFDEKKVDGKYVVCLVDETPTVYIKAKCSLLVDGDAFEMVDGALSLKSVEPSGFDITWDGNTEGLESLVGRFFKISDKVYTEDELVGANGECVMDNVTYKGTVSLSIPEEGNDEDSDPMRFYDIGGDVPEQFSSIQAIMVVLEDTELEDMIIHKGTYFYGLMGASYTSRIYRE